PLVTGPMIACNSCGIKYLDGWGECASDGSARAKLLPIHAACRAAECATLCEASLGRLLELLLLAFLCLLLVPALREQLVSAVDHEILRARRDRIGQLAEVSERGRDALWPLADRVGDQLRRFLRAQRGEAIVDLRRRDHRRAHQRHVDRCDV